MIENDALKCPFDSIDDIGVSALTGVYASECSPQRLYVHLEFKRGFRCSGLKSQEKFGKTLGLSRTQIQRTLSGTHLPETEQLLSALDRLRRTFGLADRALLRSEKRIRVIEVVLPEMGHMPKRLGASGFDPKCVDSLIQIIQFPGHAVFSSPNRYHNWIVEQVDRFAGRVTTQDLDAAGHFLAARELFDGFESRLYDDACDAALSRDPRTKESADALLSAMKQIEIIVQMVAIHGTNFRATRRHLASFFEGDKLPIQLDDELFLKDIVARWDLQLSDFLHEKSTTGFLVMESPSLCKLALTVLASNNHSTIG